MSSLDDNNYENLNDPDQGAEPHTQDPVQPQQPHRRESPYENAPYMMNHTAESQQQAHQSQQPPHEARQDAPQRPHVDYTFAQPGYTGDTWGQGSYPPPRPPKQKKHKKPASPAKKRVLAGVLTLALVASGCGITAWALTSHWNIQQADIRQDYEQQIKDLKQQVDTLTRTAGGTSVSGSPVAAQGSLTPSQVYAQNVSSVVAISSTMAPNRLGQVGIGSGSGFILTENGYIVTNHHVIDGAAQISVILNDKTEYPAKVVGSDENNDVAVLKIEAEGLPAVKVGHSSDLLIGDMVVAIGNPLGELTATQTVGYLCGKDRDVTTGGTVINMLQTDAAINAGNSGGPLFNMKGEVVGITTAKYSGTTGSGATIEGIGFAIPIDDVLGIVDDLVELGYVTGAYLGVTIQDMDPNAASMYGIPVGAYVVSVLEDGAADRAGLQAKDIIVGLGEYDVGSRSDLTRALRHFKAGDETTIRFVRSGASQEATITLDEKPKDLNAPSQPEQEMPSEGDYDEWYDYFNRFFGDIFGEQLP